MKTFVALLVVVLIASSLAQQQCGPNEHYESCGSACVPTCANKVPSNFCTYQCKIGCFCNEGYLRNNQGACVPQDSC